MNTRILPPEEWPRLVGTEAETVWPHLNPAIARVFVVEEEGRIVATWTFMHTVHAECIWVAPSHRGLVSVARRLFSGLRTVAREWGVRGVVTASLSPDVTDLIERFGGTPLPGQFFVLPAERKTHSQREEEVCQQP